MRRVLLLLMGSVLALAITVPAAGTGLDGPNQGDPDKVFVVNNPNVYCHDPVPGYKVEGDFGRFVKVWSKDPIDFVTVKSGNGAYLVWSEFGVYWGKFKISKDVSNYVVWTCPEYHSPY